MDQQMPVSILRANTEPITILFLIWSHSRIPGLDETIVAFRVVVLEGISVPGLHMKYC